MFLTILSHGMQHGQQTPLSPAYSSEDLATWLKLDGVRYTILTGLNFWLHSESFILLCVLGNLKIKWSREDRNYEVFSCTIDVFWLFALLPYISFHIIISRISYEFSNNPPPLGFSSSLLLHTFLRAYIHRHINANIRTYKHVNTNTFTHDSHSSHRTFSNLIRHLVWAMHTFPSYCSVVPSILVVGRWRNWV